MSDRSNEPPQSLISFIRERDDLGENTRLVVSIDRKYWGSLGPGERRITPSYAGNYTISASMDGYDSNSVHFELSQYDHFIFKCRPPKSGFSRIVSMFNDKHFFTINYSKVIISKKDMDDVIRIALSASWR